MQSSLHLIVLGLCLLQALDSSDAFHKRRVMKRFGLQKNRNRDENENRGFLPGTDGYMTRRSLTFEEGSINGGTQTGMEFENVALFCKVGGVPSPTVHWLKDGKRISQQPGSCKYREEDEEEMNGPYEDKLSIYSTSSTLYLDCLDETDQANYTCVAETPTHRETRSIFLTVEKVEDPPILAMKACAKKGRPARIYMGTNSVLELENNNVRLFCRASGYPAPTITWLDRDNKTIKDGGQFRISKSGDLIIKDIRWFEHMGVYTCEASNKYGTDTSSPFLYPTGRD